MLKLQHCTWELMQSAFLVAIGSEKNPGAESRREVSCTDSDVNENSFLFIRDKFTEMRPKGRNGLLTNKADAG